MPTFGSGPRARDATDTTCVTCRRKHEQKPHSEAALPILVDQIGIDTLAVLSAEAERCASLMPETLADIGGGRSCVRTGLSLQTAEINEKS